MARDYEDIFRHDDLSDDDLRALVREQLAEYETVDADNILVTATDGEVVLAGRVGTESREGQEKVLLAEPMVTEGHRFLTGGMRDALPLTSHTDHPDRPADGAAR